MKKTWATLSDILNRNAKKSLPDTMTINGQDCKDKQIIAEQFNSFFATIGELNERNIHNSLSARILHRAPPPPAPSGPKFSNSENCCGSENAMPPKLFWDMEGHRGHFRSKNVFFSKKHILEKNHNKSHYFLNF